MNGVLTKRESDISSIANEDHDAPVILDLVTTIREVADLVTSSPVIVPSRPATQVILPDDIAELYRSILPACIALREGSHAQWLYSHQLEFLRRYHGGARSLCICTPTASGKSLCFLLPIIRELTESANAITGIKHAVLMFPTKALARDQQKSIASIVAKGGWQLNIAVLDGDTEETERQKLVCKRKHGSDDAAVPMAPTIILTNPDMLHASILPNHKEKYSWLLERLAFVVLDEYHVYRGIFGSHVSCVLRRLWRLCEFYGNSSFVVMGCSATMANPRQHFECITGRPDVACITENGSGSCERTLILCTQRVQNVPAFPAIEPDSYASSLLSLMVESIKGMFVRGARIIAFCRYRKVVELAIAQLKRQLVSSGVPQSVVECNLVTYRGGYSAEYRREAERRMVNIAAVSDRSSGYGFVIVATNALELGIDIGELDVSMCLGYPGSIHSLWQQWGRAGRSVEKPALSVLFCSAYDVIEQWIMTNPAYVVTTNFESVTADSSNFAIVKKHLELADREVPIIDKSELDRYWPGIPNPLFKTVKENACFRTSRSKVPDFMIRDIAGRSIKVTPMDSPREVIDTLEIQNALLQVYPGAVHYIQGSEYEVVDFSLKTDTATVVKPTRPLDYVTEVSSLETVTLENESLRSKTTSPSDIRVCRAVVSLTAKGFFRRRKDAKRFDSSGALGVRGTYESLRLPTVRHGTTCFVLRLSPRAQAGWTAGHLHAALHALYVASLRTILCDKSDVVAYCEPWHHADELSSKIVSGVEIPVREPLPEGSELELVIYERGSAGGGISNGIFERSDEIIGLARDTLTNCSCDDGCIFCCNIINCPDRNVGISKSMALQVIDYISS